MRKEIMGVTFDDVTLEEAVAAGEALAAGPGFSYVVTPNPEIVAMAPSDGDVSGDSQRGRLGSA